MDGDFLWKLARLIANAATSPPEPGSGTPQPLPESKLKKKFSALNKLFVQKASKSIEKETLR